MIGIGILIFLVVWGLIALFLSKMLWRLIGSFGKQPQPESEAKASSWQTSKITLLQLALAALIFVLPVVDEIIAFPRYYSMCQDAGKYEFAAGMNAKKAHGREVYHTSVYEYIMLFPRFETLLTGNESQQRNVNKNTGVIVERKSIRYIDATTGELVMIYKWIEPIASFFAINWNGKEITWLLRRCDSGGATEGIPSQDFYRDLQLTFVDAPLNTLNSKAE